jgi:uncharacterized protein YjbI with pentapeptide repeats
MGLEQPVPPKGSLATNASDAVPHALLAGSAAPQPPAPAPAASTPDLPPIAAKPDDLEAIKAAVDDAASVGGGLWLSYLFVLFYLAVAAGAVTHEDLFFERSVKLPFLNIELPLLAFFFLAPILFIIAHAYTLVHLVFLTEKAKRYHQALHDPKRNMDSAARENLQWQLPSNIFIQFLAGPSSIREGLFGTLLRTIASITLVIAPMLLLLMMQIQFLPFHSRLIIWAQRIALIVDLLIIWWLWRKILAGREVDGQRRLAMWLWPPIGFALSLAVFIFSVTVVTFPGEWQEEVLPDWPILPAMAEWGNPATKTDERGKPRTASFRDWVTNAKRLSFHTWVFASEFDPATGRRRLPFSSTLVLPGLNVYEGLNIDDPDKAKGRDFIFRARGRDLKGAIFDLATLPRVDFAAAQLQGARFAGANLEGASFACAVDAKLGFLVQTVLECAQLQGAWLDNARLQGASLDLAQLQGAALDYAQLQGASLVGAQLQGAWLVSTRLQGAQLDNAELQGAALGDAALQGASLVGAQLQGAWLQRTRLQGTRLDNARLQGAQLDNAELQGASLADAQVQGASMNQAILNATNLSEAVLWRSFGEGARIAAVEISDRLDRWLPVSDSEGADRPWNGEAYDRLHRLIESIPAGDHREDALSRIRRLDCTDPDPTLASCDPSAAPPPEAVTWRNALETATVEDPVYAEALAKILKDLVCSGDQDAIYVVRGGGFQSRLQAAGGAAITVIDDLMNKDSKDCPIAASLTDADRTALLRIKQAI